jgi:hypothetical protein
MVMQPTMVQLSPDERELLASAAAYEGISRSELVRRALGTYLAGSAEAVTSRRIREGYEQIPESDDEVARGTAGARRLLRNTDLQW